jgi:antitoxin component of MazEF toxin-antitoxin module
MLKKLTRHGDSAVLIIERSILEFLGATPESLFEITTDGKSLILTPVKNDSHQNAVRTAREHITARYKESFQELAK